MSKELFVRAEEVAGVLGISKPYAYKLVREMNEELKQKGFLTIPGRVSRNYFEEKSILAPLGSLRISSRIGSSTA